MREKTFGYGQCCPADRNIKIRVMVFARAYNARHRQPGQHKGPLTRATLEVLHALLWGFHNAKTGRCFPSYEAIAAKAGCARSTVAESIKRLEAAGVLTWGHRIARIGNRLLRTSNAYRFRHMPLSQSENPPGTQIKDNQEVKTVYAETKYVVLDASNPLDAALARLGAAAGFIK